MYILTVQSLMYYNNLMNDQALFIMILQLCRYHGIRSMRFAACAHGAINQEMKSKIREVYIAHVEVGYSPILRATWCRIELVFACSEFIARPSMIPALCYHILFADFLLEANKALISVFLSFVILRVNFASYVGYSLDLTF